MKIKTWEIVLGVISIVVIIWVLFGIGNYHHAVVTGQTAPAPVVTPSTTAGAAPVIVQQPAQSWFDSPFFWLWMFSSSGGSNSSYNTSNTYNSYSGSSQSPSAADANTGGFWGSDNSSSDSSWGSDSWDSSWGSGDSGGSWGSDSSSWGSSDSGGSWGEDY